MCIRALWYKSTFVQEHNVAEHLHTRALWGEQYDPPPKCQVDFLGGKIPYVFI